MRRFSVLLVLAAILAGCQGLHSQLSPIAFPPMPNRQSLVSYDMMTTDFDSLVEKYVRPDYQPTVRAMKDDSDFLSLLELGSKTLATTSLHIGWPRYPRFQDPAQAPADPAAAGGAPAAPAAPAADPAAAGGAPPAQQAAGGAPAAPASSSSASSASASSGSEAAMVGACEVCVYVIENKEQHQPYLCRGLKDPNYQKACVEVLESLMWWLTNQVYWLNYGCQRTLNRATEWVRPCPAHAVCSWIEHLYTRQPFCPADPYYQKPQ